MSGFDEKQWPWRLNDNGNDWDWYALVDASDRYVADACVEGNSTQWRDAATALRARRNFYVKRLALAFEGGTEIRFWSPRNSMGGYASCPAECADTLADAIDEALKRTGR